jgi:hypothetical protein
MPLDKNQDVPFPISKALLLGEPNIRLGLDLRQHAHLGREEKVSRIFFSKKCFFFQKISR